MTLACVVYVTTPNGNKAKQLAKLLVQSKLAACVNIVPQVQSVYKWKGKVVTDKEDLLIIKTRKSHLKRLTQYIIKNHPYDLPEVISLPIEAGSKPYLKWLNLETR